MKKYLSILVCFILVLALLACARPPVTIDRVLVQNATASEITTVMVLHEPTKRFGKVNAILPEKALDIGLPGAKVLASQAVISWRDGEDREWSVTVDVPYDQSAAAAGQHMSLVYTIAAAGRVAAHLQASK